MSAMATADMNRSIPDIAVLAVTDDKPERAPLVELRNGKLALKQKILSFEKMSETMQEIVQFREMLEAHIERKEPPFSALPDDHRPLIAKLTQESEKTVSALAKHIQQELLPAQDEDDEESCREIQATLPLDVIEKAVKATARRVNYGLDVSRMTDAPLGARIPVAWQIWRWEVKDEHWEWLPKASREKALARHTERQQAMSDALALFNALPESDRSLVLSGNSKISTAHLKLTSVPNVPPPLPEPKPAQTPSQPVPLPSTPSTPSSTRKKDADAMNENAQQPEESESTPKGSKSVGRPKKPVDPEKAAKEKEKMEKKIAKAEREKKEKEAQSRSRNLMANFFGKPKAPSASGSGSTSATATAEPSVKKEAAASVSQFERTFKPFLLKKGASLAPINLFEEIKAGRTTKGKEKESDIIVIDDDEDLNTPQHKPQAFLDEDIQMVDASEWRGNDLGQMTAQERLQESLRGLHPRLRPPARPFPPRRHPTLKSRHPYVVRSILQQLAEAEVTGSDDATVRNLLNLLRNREKIPAKVLIFHEDLRPGYFGTWTRNSVEVGPRRPFGKDVVSLDYTVDSEAEWEEEEEGDVLDGAEEDNEPDEPTAADDDSDLDSWLVDDDEPVDPGTPVDERFGSPDFPPLPPPPKRKTKEEDESKKGTKKRKVVEQLVAFEKGPCWENTIGECAWEPFKAMRIQFFNDTPYPLDPFKFVAAHIDKVPQPPAQTVPTTKHTSQAQSTTFAVPALPNHAAGAPTDPSAAAKRGVPAPKTAFPEASMPVLLAKMKELNTGSLPVIVDGIYKELSQAVKKNAIEAKIREIGEKAKEGGGPKVWVVRPEIRALYPST